MPQKMPLVIGVTAGASTPNNKIGDTILRLFELWGEDTASLIAEVEALGPIEPKSDLDDPHEHE